MKRLRLVQLSAAAATGAATAGVLLIALAGCASSDEKPPAEHAKADAPITTDEDARAFDAAIVMAHQDDFVAAGVIRQHTIFAYHFVADSATLNELGQHDVAILAAHYASLPADRGVPPATLSVRRGDAPPALYDARVRAVTAELARGGVPTERVRVADAVPGGDGMLSGKIKLILERDAVNQPFYETHETSNTGGGVGTGGSESGVSTQGGNSK